MSWRLASLRARLLAIVMSTTLVAVAVALLGNVAANAWVLHRQNVADLQSQAELVGRMTSPALVFDDPDLAAGNLALFETRPRIHAAAIYDAQGRLFADYAAAGQPDHPPAAPGPEGARLVDGDVVVVRSISAAGAVVGTVYLRGDSGLSGALARGLVIAVIGGLLAMAAAYLMVRRLERVVTRPIGAVASAARDVVRQRDYSQRVERLDDDDFGELVDAFNAMLAEVQSRTEQLRQSLEDLRREAEERRLAQEQVQRLNEDLEMRVQARTQDLELSNRELTLAKAAADQASRAKSDFLATMSHEIRTPMNGVLGMIDVLHQSSLRGDQVEMVDLIRDSAFSLLSIIDDILDFSKIEAGRMEVESAPFPMLDVVERACAMLDHLAMKREVELTCFVDPAIPPLLLGDALRLRQVLVNLINNAIKFSSGLERPGRVWVRAECLQRTAGRAYVRLSVTDNGIGMDAEVKARLFTAFSQADSSTTRRFGGSGLGLAISHRLAELMGGQLEVVSTPGQGSRFSASFLLAEPMRGADAPGEGAALPDLDGVRCLVVGGTDGLAADLAVELRAMGVHVESTPELARTRASRPGARPDVVVVDTQGGDPSGPVLAATLAAVEDSGAGLLLVGRGPRRIPRREGARRVVVDGNVLSRRRLRLAVAMAAGRSPGDAAAVPAARDGRRAPPDRAQAIARGELILVAEDNEFNRQVVLRQLALLGYAADVAADGQQAWERWQDGVYALLLTDLHMPVLDGFGLTQRIRAVEGAGRHMPIVALTANAMHGEAERCLEAGMDAYLTKPVMLDDLGDALRRWLPEPGAIASPVSSPASSQGALSLAVLRGFVGDDPVALAGFLGGFRSNATRLGARIEVAWSLRDLPGLREQAHTLKASARMVGADSLAALCQALEDAAADQRADDMESMLVAFRAALAQAIEAAEREGGSLEGMQ